MRTNSTFFPSRKQTLMNDQPISPAGGAALGSAGFWTASAIGILLFFLLWWLTSFWTATIVGLVAFLWLGIGVTLFKGGLGAVIFTAIILNASVQTLCNDKLRVQELEMKMAVSEARFEELADLQTEEGTPALRASASFKHFRNLTTSRELGEMEVDDLKHLLIFRYIMLIASILMFGGACRQWGKQDMNRKNPDSTESSAIGAAAAF